jgi:type II secretion system protein H
MLNRRSHSLAFTLIELLMVLAIVAIMVALIAPSLRGFAIGRRANDAARQIVALTRYAQSQAVSEGRTYRLNVDPVGRDSNYWLTMQNDVGQWSAPTNENGQKFALPDGVKMDTDIPRQPDGQYVTFSPTGLVTFDTSATATATASATSNPAPGSATITLTDGLNRAVTISCASATELFRVVPSGEVSQ